MKFNIITKSLGVLALIAAFFIPQNMNPQTFKAPDFAYPQDVIAGAEDMMRNADASGNQELKLQAAIQIAIAKNDINADSFAGSVAMIDSLADASPAPWSAIFKVLEARAYNDYFEADSWRISRREPIATDTIPQNVAEWDKTLFARKITSLLTEAIQQREAMAAMPINAMAHVIEGPEADYLPAYPTFYDFFASQSLDMLGEFKTDKSSIIPFNASSVEPDPVESLMRNIADYAIEIHAADADFTALAYAMLAKCNMLPRREQKPYLESCASRLTDDAAVIPIKLRLMDFDRDNVESNNKKTYAELQALNAQFPGNKFEKAIESRLHSLRSPNVSSKIKNQFLSSEPIAVSFNVDNINEMWVMLVSIPTKMRGNDRQGILAKGKLIATRKVEIDGSVPFSTTREVNFENPGYGCYLIIASDTPDMVKALSNDRNRWIDSFIVSDLAVITANDTPSNSADIFVANGSNLKPVVGADVLTLAGKKRVSHITDKNGLAKLPGVNHSVDFEVAKGSDNCLEGEYWIGYYDLDTNESKSASIFTDLGIYHPGDTVRFSVVASRVMDRRAEPIANDSIFVRLLNVNGKEVGKQLLFTDAYGRCNGEFKLPEDDVLGDFMLNTSYRGLALGNSTVKVAEYKAPSFDVTAEASQVSDGNTFVFTGKATTWSGMPVANAKVDIAVKTRPIYWWWWRMDSADGRYNTTVETDAEGKFEVRLDASALKNTPYENSLFELTASVTSQAGETQAAAPLTFSVSQKLAIHALLPNELQVTSNEITFDVYVRNMLGKEVDEPVAFKVTDLASQKLMMQGMVEECDMKLDATKLPSGKYSIELYLKNDPSVSSENAIILWRTTDKRPPVSTPLWVPEKQITAAKGAKEVEITVGSSYAGSYVLCEIANCDRVLSRTWHFIDGVNTRIKVPAPASNGRRFVKFSAMHDLESATASVVIIPTEATEQLEIETVSFRDKLIPGSEERWTFRFTYADKSIAMVPALATMSDKALNAIAPFAWDNAGPRISYPNPTRSSFNPEISSLWNSYWWPSDTFTGNVFNGYDRPQWNFYDMPFAGTHYFSRNVYYASAPNQLNKAITLCTNEIVADGMVKESVSLDLAAPMAVAAEEAIDDAEAPNFNDVPLRPAEMPMAFFYPSLLSDADGNLELSFTVPDFNTTWQLQLLGYTPEMKSARIVLDAVASKPVMVQTNAPRFLRSGDEVLINATVYNNSDSVQNVKARLELVNPLTGVAFVSRDFDCDGMEPASSRVVGINWNVPDEMQFIAIRAYAIIDGFSDGEQTPLPILPGSTPVLESKPFWMSPDTSEIVVPLEDVPNQADLSFQFCANPIWECLKALPSICEAENNASILSLSRQFLGNCISSGIAGRYPQVPDAIRTWVDNDNALISNLYKNEDLKILALNQTIWVNDAVSRTLQMSQISNLLDEDRSNRVIADLVSKIATRQTATGGWSWCPDGKPSLFITLCVLYDIAMTRDLGYLPSSPTILSMAGRAVKYCDDWICDDIKRYKRDNYSYLLAWLYYRSMFPDFAPSKEFAKIKEKALDDIAADWKSLDVLMTADAAILMWHEGRKDIAKAMLESLRQRAEYKPERGMYFPNLNSGYDGMFRLLATTRVLRAFALIEPESEAVQGLRQWLILQNQVQEWGKSTYSAEIVAAILGTGPDVFASQREGVVTFKLKNGEELEYEMQPSGVITLRLPAAQYESCKVKCTAGAAPAWGSIYSSYVAPIQDVKPMANPDISVSKTITPVSGNRVTVCLTLQSDRDLDYVAVVDNRPACLMPVDQLSGYIYGDGISAYREVGNDATNFFIDFLPKGTHRLTFDCYLSFEGSFASGIAEAQSLYAPSVVAHTGGFVLQNPHK